MITRLSVALWTIGMLAVAGCPRKVPPPSSPPPAPGVRIVDGSALLVVTRPIEADASVVVGLAEGLREAREQHFMPDGDPLVVYEGGGRRSVAFPVAAPPAPRSPWRVREIPAGERSVLEVHGGLLKAASANDDFVSQTRALGHEIVGPIFHRLLDDPRVTPEEEVRVLIFGLIE